jgi:hypothetical protein
MLALSLLACASVPEPQPVKASADWMMLARGSLVEVSAERALYEQTDRAQFLVHVRVENLTSRPIGVDLRSFDDVFYPNQWGPSRSPHRGAVDERRFLPTGPLDPAGAAEIVAAHRAGAFTNVPARGAVEYYRAFNASQGRASVEAQSTGMPYVIVVFDGRMNASDGRVGERVDAPIDDQPRELALSTPVRWARVPPGAIVISKR